MRYFVGITGASGHVYAQGLVRELVRAGAEVDLCVTAAGAQVLQHELGVAGAGDARSLAAGLARWLGEEVAPAVRVYPSEAVGAPAASGTSRTRAVILIPCSMGTLARVAAGFSSNLVERAADVALKEGRPLVLVPRESPLSAIHLENMLKLVRLGALLIPAMPGWYHRPQSLEQLVAHLVGKVLDRLGIEHELSRRWSGVEPPAEAGTEPPPSGGAAP